MVGVGGVEVRRGVVEWSGVRWRLSAGAASPAVSPACSHPKQLSGARWLGADVSGPLGAEAVCAVPVAWRVPHRDHYFVSPPTRFHNLIFSILIVRDHVT